MPKDLASLPVLAALASAEFSLDGVRLVFFSDWKVRARYELNVFTADWSR